jgi:transaldolase
MNPRNLGTLEVYADVGSLQEIVNYKKLDFIKGFTTNPTLISKKNINKDFSYLKFIRASSEAAWPLPISIEVIADDPDEMLKQAILIASQRSNIYVKIPVVNTDAVLSKYVIESLFQRQIKINITAIFTHNQIESIRSMLSPDSNCIISIFAGRISDTGIDPAATIMFAKELMGKWPHVKILWASPREILNIFQARDLNCDIITVHPDLLDKMDSIGKDLDQFTIDTVKMFYDDAKNAKLSLEE